MIRTISGLLFWFSLIFLPIVRLKDNRLSSGVGIHFIESIRDAYNASSNQVLLSACLFILVSVMVWLTSTEKRNGVKGAKGAPVLLGHLSRALLPTLLLYQLSYTYSVATANGIGNPRILSPSIGFWLFLIAILMMGSRKSEPFNKVSSIVTILLVLWLIAGDALPTLSLHQEYVRYKTSLADALIRHMQLAFFSVMVAMIPSIWLGRLCKENLSLKSMILDFLNLFQVIPTLTLLAFMMIPLSALSEKIPFLSTLGIKGIGFAPAFIVLILYALFPITVNTLAGYEQIDPLITENALAMGMTARQVWRKVSFPLALPLIFSGIRTALTQNIGNAILAGLIGGGGFGSIIFLGLSQSAPDLIILGSLPPVLMALLTESLFNHYNTSILKEGGHPIDSTT